MLRSRLPEPWSEVDLESGWHAMENGSWRWTERVFTVHARWTGASAQPEVRLRFRLSAEVLRSKGPIQIHAVDGDAQLPACTFDSPGEHTYQQSIPAGVRMDRDLTIRFELDRALGPTGADQRELGVQVVFWDYEGQTPRAMAPIAFVPNTTR